MEIEYFRKLPEFMFFEIFTVLQCRRDLSVGFTGGKGLDTWALFDIANMILVPSSDPLWPPN